jgi:hypothetical protein
VASGQVLQEDAEREGRIVQDPPLSWYLLLLLPPYSSRRLHPEGLQLCPAQDRGADPGPLCALPSCSRIRPCQRCRLQEVVPRPGAQRYSLRAPQARSPNMLQAC